MNETRTILGFATVCWVIMGGVALALGSGKLALTYFGAALVANWFVWSLEQLLDRLRAALSE